MSRTRYHRTTWWWREISEKMGVGHRGGTQRDDEGIFKLRALGVPYPFAVPAISGEVFPRDHHVSAPFESPCCASSSLCQL